MSTDTPRPERVTLSTEEREALICDCADSPSSSCVVHGAGYNLALHDPDDLVARVERILAAREKALREGHKAERARIGRLHEALALSGMTPSALAETVGMPLASLQNVLYLRRPPSTTEFVAFANALGVDPNWLHAGDAARIAREAAP